MEKQEDKMPDFGNPFSGLKHDRKLTDQELVRAIRFMVSAEYEAIQLYQQLAESTDNTLAQAVLMDIADEEKVHAGEFLRLLKELDPQEEEFYKQGYQEVEDEFLSGTTSAETPTQGEDLGIGSLKKK
jgi:rubrerythrin